jgi:TPR repeat protein
LKAREDNDFITAVKEWQPLAEKGDINAQWQLGSLYYSHALVTNDYKLAVKWHTLAAEQGDERAQWRLGNMYYVGEGVPRDYKKAIEWFTRAAEQGNENAPFILGNMYYAGKGVPENYKEAFKWYTLAAEQGYPKVQTILGDMYYYGQGVPRNYKKAVEWYTLAGKHGYRFAIIGLDSLKNKYSDWSSKEKEASTTLVDLEKSRKNYVTATVSFSSSGNRNLYFQVEYDDLKCEADKDLKKPLTDIWSFNKQAVKMLKWCKKYTDSESNYLQLTPKSYKGFKFVVSAFREATSTVAIKTGNINFEISSKGFTKVWNSLSSTAL